MQEDELRKINNFILYIAKGHSQALEALYENIGGRMLAVAFSITGRWRRTPCRTVF